MRILIKGKFYVETDGVFMDNVKQPLEELDLQIIDPNPVKVNYLKCKVQDKGVTDEFN